MITVEMKLPIPIQHEMPCLNAPDIEWCHYYRQFGIRYHLANCPIHEELWGEY